MGRRTGEDRVTYDLVVLGGGTAGLVAALGAAAVGARACLVEQARIGGDCLWTGCVPSKSLIAAADAAQRARDATRFGVDTGEPRVDFARVMAHVRGAIAAIEPHDSAERLARDGVTVVHGHGRFVDDRTIRVATDSGDRDIRFHRALIATGSEPTLPPVEGLAELAPLTTDTVWDLEQLPRRLVLIGGGSIGCELGQAFARLGSRVTLLEAAPRLLPRDHPDAAAILHARLVANGVEVRVGAKITHAARRDALVIDVDGETLQADALLVAAGRRPRTDDLALERVSVELTDRGHVVVDSRLRTTTARIYAAGDVTGAPAFTHVAGYHGGVVVQNALLGLRRSVSYEAVPAVTYTDPEVAQVGLLEADARERHGTGIRIARFEHSALDRAITEAETVGFTELIANRKGYLVGATVVGAAAGEVIAELAAAIRAGKHLRDLAGAVHAYPTRSEAVQRAALEDLRRSLVRLRRPASWIITARRHFGK